MKSRKRSRSLEISTCFPLSSARSSLVILTFYWGWQGKYMQDHEGAGWSAAGMFAQFVQFNLALLNFTALFNVIICHNMHNMHLHTMSILKGPDECVMQKG